MGQEKNGACRWEVGDYILAGDGPLCLCTVIDRETLENRAGQWTGRIILGERLGSEWFLNAGEPYNKRLTREQAVTYILFGKVSVP